LARRSARFDAVATLLLLVFGIAIAPSSARAADDAADDGCNITAVLELGAQYISDRWVPVRVELVNPTSRDIDGYVSMPVRNRGAAFVVRQPCKVPARTSVRLVLLGMFTAPDDPARGGRQGSTLGRVDWYSSAGQRLAMTDLFGAAQSTVIGAISKFGETSLLTIGDQRHQPSGAAAPGPSGAGLLAAIPSAWIDVTDAPRQRAGYDGCRIVALDHVDPDTLDLAQRQALLDHLTTGGVLLLPAPEPSNAISWLLPYWPVECLGQRSASAVELRLEDGAAMHARLRSGTRLTQALTGEGGVVVARDAAYVHIAFKSVGLGRLVFTSFPLDALDGERKAAEDALEGAMGVATSGASWESSQLGERQVEHLEAMVGTSTAPWWVAACIVIGYLVVAAGIHCTFSGARRPMAFVAVVVAALGGTAILLGMSVARQRGSSLSGARIATLDLSPTGGGLYQETLAFVGEDEPALSLAAHGPGATLQPIAAADGGNAPPTIITDPFAAPNAAARSAAVERIWRATCPIAFDRNLAVTGVFGPAGLMLSSDNRLGDTVASPILVWNATGSVHPLGDIVPGEVRDLRVGPLNAPDDFTSSAFVVPESARLRGLIAKAAFSPSSKVVAESRDAPPMVAGWLGDDALPSLLRITPQPAMRSLALLRAPLALRASEVGTHVAIDGAFVRLVPGPIMGLPYDESRHAWLATSTTGQWLIGFVPPKQIGRLRPTRVTLACDPAAPRHVVSLVGDQLSGQKLRPNANGRTIAQWPQPVARQEVAFAPTPKDLDGYGHVWLMLRVQLADSAEGSPSPPPQWIFRDLRMTYDAEVVAPSPTLNPPGETDAQ
jgi:hypothetical protein